MPSTSPFLAPWVHRRPPHVTGPATLPAAVRRPEQAAPATEKTAKRPLISEAARATLQS